MPSFNIISNYNNNCNNSLLSDFFCYPITFLSSQIQFAKRHWLVCVCVWVSAWVCYSGEGERSQEDTRNSAVSVRMWNNWCCVWIAWFVPRRTNFQTNKVARKREREREREREEPTVRNWILGWSAIRWQFFSVDTRKGKNRGRNMDESWRWWILTDTSHSTLHFDTHRVCVL